MNLKTKNRIVIEEFRKAGFSNYYMQMFDEKCDLSNRIYLLLKFIGMDQSITGFDYTKEMIKIVIEQPKAKYEKVEYIYNKIYQKYESKSISSIERAIRHSKEKCLETINPDVKVAIFGNSKTETNLSFIYGLANFISSL